MGRMSGSFFQRAEFVEAIQNAVENELGEAISKKQASAIFEDLCDSVDGFTDAFEDDDSEDDEAADEALEEELEDEDD